MALTRLGHEVAVARDGRGLVELRRTVRPDLIVTDIRMPGVVSAYPPADLATQAPAPVILLRKPVGLADLERAIGEILGHPG